MTEQTIRIALLGYTAHVRPYLESLGDVQIDCFSDGAGVALDMCRQRRSYDLVVIHAPYGEGFPPLPFQYDFDKGKTCPVYMINDPPGGAARSEVKLLLDKLRADKAQAQQAEQTAQAVTIEPRNREEST